jgi:hypothetical protein
MNTIAVVPDRLRSFAGRAIPHVVPVCFTISQGTLYITIDEKPKRVAGSALKHSQQTSKSAVSPR